MDNAAVWGYLTAFGLGFFGSAHCVGMCGGIVAALSFAVPEAHRSRRFSLLLSYNVGRIISYGLMGALVGGAGALINSGHGVNLLRTGAGLLLVAMGLYLAGWWRGITYLERAGNLLWQFIQPLSKRLLPVTTLPRALLLGGVWGWLPCGLIYSGLAFAATTGSALTAGSTMLAFGSGTLPAILASGLLAEKLKSLLQQRRVRVVFGCSVLGFGIWTLVAASFHSNHDGVHSSHQHSHASVCSSELNCK